MDWWGLKVSFCSGCGIKWLSTLHFRWERFQNHGKLEICPSRTVQLDVIFERRCILQKTTQNQHTGNVGITCRITLFPSHHITLLCNSKHYTSLFLQLFKSLSLSELSLIKSPGWVSLGAQRQLQTFDAQVQSGSQRFHQGPLVSL